MRPVMPLVILAALLLPSVGADHVFSHRYVFEGRLVGIDGLPLPGRTVTFSATGGEFIEACAGTQHEPVTNEEGDFSFCYHRHDLSTATRITVSSGNATLTRAIDTFNRRNFGVLREPNETGAAPPDWNVTYRLSGHVIRKADATLEGVRVFGIKLAEVPVNVTLSDGERETPLQLMTDVYGDFDAKLRVDANATNVTLRMESMGQSQVARLDPTSHRTWTRFALPEANGGLDGDIQASFPANTGAAALAPGTQTPRWSPMLLLAVGLAVLAMVAMARRAR